MKIIGVLWLSASMGWMWDVQGSLVWVVSPTKAGLGAQGSWKC